MAWFCSVSLGSEAPRRSSAACWLRLCCAVLKHWSHYGHVLGTCGVDSTEVSDSSKQGTNG